MSTLADFDENGNWIGPCDKCGTNHDGYPPDTLGGESLCVTTHLRELAADAHPVVARHIYQRIAHFDARMASARERGMEIVRRYFES